MRLVCISDTHGIHDRMEHPVPDGDILLHAGDVTRSGRIEDLGSVNDFFESLPHPHKFYVPGNHDWCFETEADRARELVTGASCLIDEGIEVAGIKIWGSPWQPEFHDWAFNLPRGERLAEKWNLIPGDTDVVITHGPPADILDRCSDGRHEGCRDLAARIVQIGPQLHLFGHIHEAYGREEHDGICYVNASICNLGYRPVNAPVIVDLPESHLDITGVDP